MRKLVVVISTALYLFTIAASASAQTAVLTATVAINPLEVKISDPGDIPIRKWVEISAVVSNHGPETITKTVATLHGSPKLNIKGKKNKIGNLASGEETVTWQVKANSSGNFVIQVEVTGELASEQISASDSTLMISTTDLLGFSLFRLIFGV